MAFLLFVSCTQNIFFSVPSTRATDLAEIQRIIIVFQGTYSWKMLWKCYYSKSAINISCYEELSMLSELVFLKCYAMTEFVFLHFSIEALVINFYKKMDCYQKVFHCYQSILEPAIHLLSNWRERKKILAKRKKWEVYRRHFVNHLANHFSHFGFRRSRQVIGIFTKRQRSQYGKFLIESKMNKIGDIVR